MNSSSQSVTGLGYLFLYLNPSPIINIKKTLPTYIKKSTEKGGGGGQSADKQEEKELQHFWRGDAKQATRDKDPRLNCHVRLFSSVSVEESPGANANRRNFRLCLQKVYLQSRQSEGARER